jgi:hypothetical protein
MGTSIRVTEASIRVTEAPIRVIRVTGTPGHEIF